MLGFLFSLVLHLASLLRRLLRIVKDLHLALAIGYSKDGFRGARNLVCAALQRGNGRRLDGLHHVSPLVVRGVRMCAFRWFDRESFTSAIDSLVHLPLRKDDVFVVSYQKCGHHFIHEVLHMLLSGEARLHPEDKHVNFLEVYPRPVERFSKMASPRVIMTHLPYGFLPKRIFEGNCRIVRISRNPKDMLVSYYHHCRNIKSYFYEDSLENFLRLNLDEPSDAENGSYFDYELEYHRELRGKDHVIHLTFEQLKKKPERIMRKLGEFLGFDYDEEFYRQVAKATAFEKVKADKDPANSGMMKPGGSMYRRGVVGDWRRHLTVAMSDAIDAKIEEKWKGTPLLDFFDYGE